MKVKSPTMSYNVEISDDEVDIKQHSRLLDDVLQLDRKQHVKKPSRTESSAHISEFNLIKPADKTVHIDELSKALQSKTKLSQVGKKVEKARTAAKTLDAPLEKPQAERIRRSVGFEKVQAELGKWDSIIIKNRVASHQKFPLDAGSVDFEPEKKRLIKPIKKTELELELEKIDATEVVIDEPEQFPLSMDELLERRKEMARLRAHQSYQVAKQHRKKKIKSKTYHRVERKEKLRQKLKEFEMLRKTDPEAALRKLEQLEQARAEERMSLRHKSTGQWARNKLVRAKYDKESRQVLAQQLSLSRELTQKVVVDDSSDSEPEAPPKPADPNPWVAPTSEVTDFVNGYRNHVQRSASDLALQKEIEKNVEIVERELAELSDDDKSVTVDLTVDEPDTPRSPPKRRKRKRKIVVHADSTWEVSDIATVEDIFDDLESAAQTKLDERIELFKQELKGARSQVKPKPAKRKPNKIDLTLPRERMRPEIDEELYDRSKETERTSGNDLDVQSKTNVDPNKYMNVKCVNLNTELPVSVVEDDEQKAYIMEAFKDDDVIDEFHKEKRTISDKDKPEDVNLALPGWGNWGNAKRPERRRRKRFIIKFPQKIPRRDDNRGNLILNEHKDTAVRAHQVTEVPFPFSSVKDFEASIRAPIGDTFVPQTAFRRLVKPALVTKKGAIIEPMDREELLRGKFTKNARMVNR